LRSHVIDFSNEDSVSIGCSVVSATMPTEWAPDASGISQAQ
jgi:hypothetical protein